MSVELEIRTTVVGNEYIATMALTQWSSSDLELMAAYGEPIIDVGGAFENSPVEFELPENNVRLRRDFPIVQRFDAADNEDAEAHRDLWVEDVTDRISAALTTLRANTHPVGVRSIDTI